jgi:hypothetical protein
MALKLFFLDGMVVTVLTHGHGGVYVVKIQIRFIIMDLMFIIVYG